MKLLSADELQTYMDSVDGFDNLKTFTELFLPPYSLLEVGAASILSSDLREKMMQPPTTETLARYWATPLSQWRIDDLLLYWTNIQEGLISREEEFLVMREGEKILLGPIWKEMAIVTMMFHSGELEIHEDFTEDFFINNNHLH